MGKQMTAKAGASISWSNWYHINWDIIEAQVKRLQMRIAKATRESDHGRLKSLQWLLTHSYYAKLLAIKRVTTNRGRNTPGVDNIVWRSAAQKLGAVNLLQRRGYQPKPLRRVYIPKKNGKLRPLGIPSMTCRAQQALYLLALEPVAESIADNHAYGFCPYRSCADAIEQCFKVLACENRPKWVLEGDIKACFDKINHKWLLDNVPMDKAMLAKWLKAGFIDKGQLFPTREGTPQGGIISPTLLTITLAGLDKAIKSVALAQDKINLVTYADDFIVTGATREILEETIKPAIERFMLERGLELSSEKTLITHIDNGFDFLGFNIRKYNGKLLTKPSKKNITAFLDNIRQIIKTNATAKTENLIYLLNPKLRGWANYYRHGVSSRTFSTVDHNIFVALRNWAKRRHPNKDKDWIDNKYFCSIEYDNWVFNAGTRVINECTKLVKLFKLHSTKIVRHVKIRADANPYNPADAEYFKKRELSKSKYKQLAL
jgi:RNA-directed DNA polymerase